MDLAWRLPVLMGRHEAEYYRCRRCSSLQVPNPTWLDEAYSREAEPPGANDRDTGRFRRNYSAFLYLSALADVGAFPAAPDILDFGGGYGLMTQMLLDAGYSAWTSDPHVPKPYFAPDHVVADLSAAPPGTYDLVLALEVFEHLVQPVEVGESLARVLRAGGSLLISTEIYKPDQHGPEWGYLATEGGQHVNFWSQRALEIFAAHLGFTSIGLYPGDTGFLIVMSHLDEGTLAARLQAALERLDDPAFLASCLRPWDFRTSGVIPAGARPLARSVQLGDVLR